MKRLPLISISLLMLGVAACDAVRVPGPDVADEILTRPSQTETEVVADQSEAPSDMPAAPLEETSDIETPNAPNVLDNPEVVETDTTEPDISETDLETDTDEETETTDASEPDATAESETDGAPISLAAMNAIKCGLLQDGEDTSPTVAMVAGATTVDESTVGLEAVNALAAQLSAYPGIVKLEPRNIRESGAVESGHCGATRISDRWFLTAAHCIDKPYDELRLVVGSENIRGPLASNIDGITAICHGGYNGSANGYANDIALIRVNDNVEEALEGVPIASYAPPQRALVPVNYETVDMAGWGIVAFGGQLSSELLGASLALKSSGPAAIQVSSIAGAGPCIGDSGGPLYVTEADGTRTVIGVLSVVEQNRETGEFCAGAYNGRYTNVEGYRDWISTVIGACEGEDDLC